MKCPICNSGNVNGATFSSPQIEILGEAVTQENAAQPQSFDQYSATDPNGNCSHKPSGNPSRNWGAILGLVIGIILMPMCLCGVGLTIDIWDKVTANSIIPVTINLFIAII